MHITFLIAKYGRGGVERMMVNTASGLAELGLSVDYIAPEGGPYLDQLDSRVVFCGLPLGRRERFDYVCTYLRREAPDCIIVAKDKDLKLALSARKRVASNARIIMRPGTTILSKLDSELPLIRWYRRRTIARVYREADALVVNAEAVRNDVSAVTGISADEIYLTRNPVINNRMLSQADGMVEHEWLKDKSVPVIIGIGNLHRVKDFPTLLEAFSIVRQQRAVKLIILGEGHLRDELKSLAVTMGVGEDVDFAGFVDNPYPYIKSADLYVLSSVREGSPNALTEALALGTPVVATDCPGGVREILKNGRWGRIVPVRSPYEMARAISATLDSLASVEELISSVNEYTQENAAKSYCKMINMVCDNNN